MLANTREENVATPLPILNLLRVVSIPISPACKTGLYRAQFAVVSLRSLKVTFVVVMRD
jgi:hypothetical protein